MALGQKISLGTVLKGRAEGLIEVLKKNLRQNDSIASRKLIQSIAPRISIFGNVFTMEILMEDYWRYVDEGRKPGKQPPIEPIMKWISQKGIPLSPISKTRNKKIRSLKNRTVRKGFRQRSKTSLARSLAFLIARKIGRKGIQPTNFLTDEIQPWINGLRQDLITVLKRNYTIDIKYYNR